MLRYEYLTIVHDKTNDFAPSGNALRLTGILNTYARDGWWLFAIYPQDETIEYIVFERVAEKEKTEGNNHARIQ